MKVDEVKEKYDLDDEGVVGKAFHVEADEGNYLASFKLEDQMVAQMEEEDHKYRIMAVLSIFKFLFKMFFSPHDLKGVKFYGFFEVDKSYFTEEIQAFIDGGKHVVYMLDPNENEEDKDGITKYVPDVKVLHEEEDEDGEG